MNARSLTYGTKKKLFGPREFASFLPTCFEFQEFFFFDWEEVIRSSSNVSSVRQVVGYRVLAGHRAS
jgi:hypothetical protein